MESGEIVEATTTNATCGTYADNEMLESLGVEVRRGLLSVCSRIMTQGSVVSSEHTVFSVSCTTPAEFAAAADMARSLDMSGSQSALTVNLYMS